MKSIQITESEAEILSSGHAPATDHLRRELIRRAQCMANETGHTVEIYHPEGYVFDARTPEVEA